MVSLEVTDAAGVILLLVALALLGVIVYFIIDFWNTKKKLDKILNKPTESTPSSSTTESTTSLKDKIISANTSMTSKVDAIMNDPRLYDPSKSDYYVSLSDQVRDGGVAVDKMYMLMILMRTALTDIKNNIETLSEPGFYQQSIETVLIRYPFYRSIMQLVSYIYNNPEITSKTIDDALVRLYGSKNSSELYVKIKGLNYYIVLELDDAFTYYEINRKYVDSFLGISPK
jgi:uncharacterized protein YneF (UPF0154 family)